ncbi:hypothetical protein [Salinimicrobium sediminilitoris]|uniref:hypothetical protein n=1 Tax=Salinimicrobium sediminilitoris TaxID=2876715 RepID=UPI001E2E20A7|nr:hypothetical protein [Salinimicrobium sediminilitoris]MCC8358322.1 hypothetical protein [Salinimicrobium sediminilitoris]
MKNPYLYWLLLIIGISTSFNLQGQGIEDHSAVKQVYEILQDKNTTSQDIVAISPGFNWNLLENQPGVNNRYNITLNSIMKNEWGSLQFDDLIFKTEENEVFVTGVVKGRRPLDCEFISTRFLHHWSLNAGEIVGFTEGSQN